MDPSNSYRRGKSDSTLASQQRADWRWPLLRPDIPASGPVLRTHWPNHFVSQKSLPNTRKLRNHAVDAVWPGLGRPATGESFCKALRLRRAENGIWQYPRGNSGCRLCDVRENSTTKRFTLDSLGDRVLTSFLILSRSTLSKSITPQMRRWSPLAC